MVRMINLNDTIRLAPQLDHGLELVNGTVVVVVVVVVVLLLVAKWAGKSPPDHLSNSATNLPSIPFELQLS